MVRKISVLQVSLVPFRVIAPAFCRAVKAWLTFGRLAPISRASSLCEMPRLSWIFDPWCLAIRAEALKERAWRASPRFDTALSPQGANLFRVAARKKSIAASATFGFFSTSSRMAL
jgi:hypothetical protein